MNKFRNNQTKIAKLPKVVLWSVRFGNFKTELFLKTQWIAMEKFDSITLNIGTQSWYSLTTKQIEYIFIHRILYETLKIILCNSTYKIDVFADFIMWTVPCYCLFRFVLNVFTFVKSTFAPDVSFSKSFSRKISRKSCSFSWLYNFDQCCVCQWTTINKCFNLVQSITVLVGIT